MNVADNEVRAAQPGASGHDNLKARIFSESEAFLYITIYFWVLFLAFDLYRSGILEKFNIGAADETLNIVKALVLGKVTLVVESLYGRRRLRNVPLFFAVLSHALLLSVILLASLFLEKVIKGMVHGDSFTATLAGLAGGHIGIPLSLGAIFFVVMIPLCAFQELGRLVGRKPLSRAFFGSRKGLAFRLVTESDDDSAARTDGLRPPPRSPG
jgi:hypothetical protein